MELLEGAFEFTDTQTNLFWIQKIKQGMYKDKYKKAIPDKDEE